MIPRLPNPDNDPANRSWLRPVTKAFNPRQPRDSRGRWSGAEGSPWDRPARGIVDRDNPTINDGGLWGASHANSKAITGSAAKLMGGVEGYDDSNGNQLADNRAQKFLTAIYNSPGSKEPLYHGFDNEETNVEFNPGDVFTVPLLATTGDIDLAAGFGVSPRPGSWETDPATGRYRVEGPEAYTLPTVLEFPIGTRIAAYAKSRPSDVAEFGYQMDEALVSGEFRVVSTRRATEDEGVYRAGTRASYTVVRVEPVRVFNPDTREWEDIE